MPNTTKPTRKTAFNSRPPKRLAVLAKATEAPKSRIWARNEVTILSGAERVFARAGFEGATMAQGYDPAGVEELRAQVSALVAILAQHGGKGENKG